MRRSAPIATTTACRCSERFVIWRHGAKLREGTIPIARAVNMATTNDIDIFAGDSLDIHHVVADPDGVPVDLVGAQAVYAVAKSVKDAEPLFTKRSTAPGEIDLSITGDITIHLRSADTENMPKGNYYHEAQVTLPDGRTGTVLTGRFRIRANLIVPR